MVRLNLAVLSSITELITPYSLLGLPIPSEEKQSKGQNEDNALAQPEEILSSFPRRYATIEEVDDALYKTRTRVGDFGSCRSFEF